MFLNADLINNDYRSGRRMRLIRCLKPAGHNTEIYQQYPFSLMNIGLLHKQLKQFVLRENVLVSFRHGGVPTAGQSGDRRQMIRGRSELVVLADSAPALGVRYL